MTETTQQIPHIKISHSQIGMAIEARLTDIEEWQMVELQKYRTLPGGGIAPWAQERDYFTSLDNRGIKYIIWRNRE